MHGGARKGGDTAIAFQALWTFEAQGNKTKLTMSMTFPIAEARDKVVKEYNAIEGGNQTLGRLEEYLSGKKPAFELVLTQVIAAPRERVYEAWTKPEQMAQWFAPKPYQLIVGSMDFRIGGKFSMAMQEPLGDKHAFTGTYRDIAPPAKLSWTGEFTGGSADQISTVVTFEGPASPAGRTN